MPPEFLKYHKAVDPEGNPIAVICEESEAKITVISYNTPKARFTIQHLARLSEVPGHVGGQIVPTDPEEYDKILFERWRFSISEAVTNAKQSAPEQPPVKDAEEAGNVVSGTTEMQQDTATGETGQPVEEPATDPADFDQPDNDGTPDTAGTGGDTANPESATVDSGNNADVPAADSDNKAA